MQKAHFIRKLKSLNEKIQSHPNPLDGEFLDLMGVKLFNLIQKNKELKEEVDSRLNFVERLAKNKEIIAFQDDLIKKIIEISKLVRSVTQLKIAQREYEEGTGEKVNPPSRLKFKCGEFIELTELHRALKEGKNYFRLGAVKGVSQSEEVSTKTPTYEVLRQYETLENLYFKFIAIYLQGRKKESYGEFVQKLSEYKDLFFEFRDRVLYDAKELNVLEFERFYGECALIRPVKGKEFYYESGLRYGGEGLLQKYFRNNAKKLCGIVIENLIDFCECGKKAVLVPDGRPDDYITLDERIRLRKPVKKTRNFLSIMPHNAEKFKPVKISFSEARIIEHLYRIRKKGDLERGLTLKTLGDKLGIKKHSLETYGSNIRRIQRNEHYGIKSILITDQNTSQWCLNKELDCCQ